MTKGIGIDIESIDRIDSLVARYDAHVLRLIYTEGELQRCRCSGEPARQFAICFVAKEAMSKALGTGFATIDWCEIEVHVRDNEITLSLYGKALERATSLSVTGWKTHWSQHDNHIIVQVVIY